MQVDELRSEFPALGGKTYLNWASLGLIPKAGVAAGAAALTAQAESGDGIIGGATETLQRLRQRVAGFLGADASEIAFLRNTVEGLSTVASGFPWREGDNVLVGSIEFPANVYPWLYHQRQGVEVRFVERTNRNLSVDDFVRAADGKTRMVTVSAVQFTNGYRIDLAALSEFCRDRDIRLVVDAIQALGVAPLDLGKIDVDYMASGVHKWLCGPVGFGIFYARRDRLAELTLNEVGHGSYDRTGDSWLDYGWSLRDDARRFEAGVLSYAHAATCDATLGLIENVGVETIHRHVTGLTAKFIESLQARGYSIRSSQPPEKAAGIVTFASDRHSPKHIQDSLKNANVVVSSREGAIRVSIHGVNAEEDIERLLAALP